jgi:hypothetical protein
VRSPGWYAHVFAHPGSEGVARWFVGAARLLRAEGLSASPDHLIAATRTASALAALRGRPRPGLAEVLDAADTVMAGSVGVALIERELIVGDAIGEVPDDAPQVPLRDYATAPGEARADRRCGTRFAHPLGRAFGVAPPLPLGVPWGSVEEGRGSSGTFRETWSLRWEPELAIGLIERAAYGTTVQAAATGRLLERAASSSALASLVAVLDAALLADLPTVVQPVVERGKPPTRPRHGRSRGAGPRQADAYGDVRHRCRRAAPVFDGLVVRVMAGTVIACRSLDDDAAAVMVERLASVQAALALTDHPSRRGEWPALLAVVSERRDVHGLVQGRAARLLHDGGAWRRAQVGNRVSRALSVGTPPAVGAAFVEGFLAGSGTVLPPTPSCPPCRCCGARSARSSPPSAARSVVCWPTRPRMPGGASARRSMRRVRRWRCSPCARCSGCRDE